MINPTMLARTRMSGEAVRKVILSAGLVITLLVVVVYFSITAQGFADLQNLRNVARDVSLIGIVAVGMTLLVLTGNIDLSVGSVLGVSGIYFAELMVSHGASVPAALAAAVLIGALLGMFNGLVVTLVEINPIIVTLATWTAFRGLAFLITDGVPIFGLPDGVRPLGEGLLIGVPVPVWLMLASFAAGWVVLNRTAVGRRIYAIGGNREAARLSGIRVKRITVLLFMTVGAMAGLAGVLATARLESAAPAAGTGFEISVITAVFVGGVSYTGGEGRLGGVFLGVVILGVLQNGMTLNAVQPFIQQVVLGGFLLSAVAFDQALTRISRRVPYHPHPESARPPLREGQPTEVHDAEVTSDAG
jgi:ribose transport system permease protein